MRAIFAIVLLAACADDPPIEDLEEAVADGRAENLLHHDKVLAADSLAAVLEDLDRHETEMDGVVNAIDGAMFDMQDCTPSVMMSDLDDKRFDLAERMLEHRMALMIAPSLVAARAESDVYQAELIDIFHDMDEALAVVTCP